MDQRLIKKLVKVIEDGQPLYWQAAYPFIDLRAITYTFETGKERTKSIYEFHLSSQLKEILRTQYHLETLKYAPPRETLIAILEDAYWKKHIPHHPRGDAFAEKVFQTTQEGIRSNQ